MKDSVKDKKDEPVEEEEAAEEEDLEDLEPTEADLDEAAVPAEPPEPVDPPTLRSRRSNRSRISWSSRRRAPRRKRPTRRRTSPSPSPRTSGSSPSRRGSSPSSPPSSSARSVSWSNTGASWQTRRGCSAGIAPEGGPSFLVSLPIALASGLLVSAASPPLGWWPLAFVGVAPFLWLLRSAGGARGAALGFPFGLGSFGAALTCIRCSASWPGSRSRDVGRVRGRVRPVRPGGPAPRPTSCPRSGWQRCGP